MIGGAALVIGLLLILTWIGASRIPARASFASSGVLAPLVDAAGGGLAGRRSGDSLRAFLFSPVHPATWYATAGIVRGLFVGVFGFAVLASLFSSGASTLFVGIGVLFMALGIEWARVVARLERRRAMLADSRPLIPHPYRPFGGGWRGVLRAEFGDENRWRDVLYVGVSFPLVIIEFSLAAIVWALALVLVTMPIWYDAAPGGGLPSSLGGIGGHELPLIALRFLVGAALLPVAASLSQLLMALHRAVVAGILCTSDSGELRRQVETLRESRSAVLLAEASELRRIERDLHDGAQQRLVMLTMDLGLASEKIDSDPAAARQLVLEGRDQAHQALAEIRQLVRGIAPAILLDRGLVAAIGSIAAHGPVSTSVVSNLEPAQRLPDNLERAAYFVVTEALTNVAKHSGASRCEVRVNRAGSWLVVEIQDDGAGGAVVGPGGGLAGLAGRLEAVEGRFSVSSPHGGPTIVRAELPIPVWTSGRVGPEGAAGPFGAGGSPWVAGPPQEPR